MKSGIELITDERLRQRAEEFWTSEHDDQHIKGELPHAARCYLGHAIGLIHGLPVEKERMPKEWPFYPEWWKPSTAIRDLTKAGALIAAEIDRLQRPDVPSYKLASRYPEVVTTLTLISEGKWRFKTSGSHFRSGRDAEGYITMVDPEGGPFIAVGFQFADQVVEQIVKDDEGFVFLTRKMDV